MNDWETFKSKLADDKVAWQSLPQWQKDWMLWSVKFTGAMLLGLVMFILLVKLALVVAA